jgi:MarR family transcriptional regulator, organic hydroperoxide resistance regulator
VNKKQDLEIQALGAAAEFGINSVLFRNAMGRKLGLNITDSECLSVLGIKGISTPTELARYTGLTTGSTTAMLDRLEKAGFIHRKPNPKDRRGIFIEINKQSTEKTWPLVAGIQKAHKELLASYSQNELEIIADFLTRFTDNVKEHTTLIEEDLSASSKRV